MPPYLVALSLVAQLLPYVTKTLELIARISSDKAVQAKLRKRAREMAFEAADNLLVQLESELDREDV